MTDEDLGSMDAETNAYFESRGEKVPDAPPAPPLDAPEDADAAAAAAVEGAQKLEPTVPLRAVTREREEKKQLRDALNDMERKYAVLTDRWDTMLKGAQPQQPEPAEPPDPDKDIFAALRYEREQRAALEAKINGREAEEANARKAAEMENNVWTFWEQEVQAFKAETADFGDAATWLAEWRDKQLQSYASVDPRLSAPEARANVINAELKAIVIQAAQQRRSPAEMVYAIAKGNGYTAKAKEPAAGAIANLAKNTEAEISLSAANGSRQPASPDAETIANMSEAEFAKWFDKAGSAGFRRIAG